LWECQDPALAEADSRDLLQAFEAAGATACSLQNLPWGESVACDDASRLRAFGLRLRELRAEISSGGTRRVSAISTTSSEQLEQRMKAPAAGLLLSVETREDGAGILVCVAQQYKQGTDALHGAIQGRLPALPAGAYAWEVCARQFSEAPRCLRTPEAGYRLGALPPADYRLQATPIGAADPHLRAVLTRKVTGASADRGSEFLLDHLSVRAGSVTEAPELTLMRLRD
jgi:hypothetical protein